MALADGLLPWLGKEDFILNLELGIRNQRYLRDCLLFEEKNFKLVVDYHSSVCAHRNRGNLP